MLLPHGHEGQGPDHSQARLERFLQLCAEDNLQVCYPTTPAQFFHMLRRQMRRGGEYRRPLIVMSPKSLLRNPLCVSTLDEFTGKFHDWLDEPDPIDKSKVRRVILCSGKIYFELLDARRKQKINDITIIRLEQIYPFDADRLTELLQMYPKNAEIAWVQEEPQNNGVYPFISTKLKELFYVGRKPSASPAAGSYEQHV